MDAHRETGSPCAWAFGHRLKSSPKISPCRPVSPWLNSANNGRAVTFSGTENWDCSLQGFTIQKNSAYAYGGGIAGNGCEASIMYCKFINNSISGNGACINNVDGIIDRNVFGAYDVNESWISSNIASGAGGACYDCDGIIRLNIFWCNQASSGGALAYCGDTVTAGDTRHGFILSNWFIKNRSASVYGGGGAMDMCNGNTIMSNMFWKNEVIYAYTTGGAMSYYYPLKLKQNTFVSNTANGPYGEGGAIYDSYGTDEGPNGVNGITNFIFWDNSDSTTYAYDDLGVPSTTNIRNCYTIQNLTTLVGANHSGCIGDANGPGFITQSFDGTNFHDFLHLDTDPMSSCIDRGYTIIVTL